jgi:RNA methyltransferase, TrmH family
MAQPRKVSTQQGAIGRSATITSRDNRWLKRFRSALSGDASDDGLVGVEGVRLVEAALGSGLLVEALLTSNLGERHLPRLAPLLSTGMQVLRTTDRLFAGIADTKTPQGIAALVQPAPTAIEDLLHGTPLVTVLIGVQDPGNVGTILRAAEAFGATGAATCPAGAIGTADPLAPKALRASAGSALRLPLLRGIAPAVLLSQLRVSRVKIYAAVAGGAFSKKQAAVPVPRVLRPWEVDWKSASALLIGNEGSGLPEEIVRAADARVSIPQATAITPVGIESLNAAMAAAVLLYEAMRQRL